jgi:hypothetical protein
MKQQTLSYPKQPAPSKFRSVTHDQQVDQRVMRVSTATHRAAFADRLANQKRGSK